jgi:hypothetical protein
VIIASPQPRRSATDAAFFSPQGLEEKGLLAPCFGYLETEPIAGRTSLYAIPAPAHSASQRIDAIITFNGPPRTPEVPGGRTRPLRHATATWSTVSASGLSPMAVGSLIWVDDLR